MAGLTQDRMTTEFRFKYLIFTLESGNKAFKGGIACLDLAGSGSVVIGQAGSSLVRIGIFAEDVDATSGALPVNVELDEEVVGKYYDNDTVAAVASSNIGSMCFVLDDHTVTMASLGNSPAGRVWKVDSVKGVLVERDRAIKGADQILAAPAFSSNNSAPAAVVQGAVYTVPATGAASTITLPAAAPDGTHATFVADGTLNANTVQYVDATGPTNLTTALTASKRHMVLVEKAGGKWFANAYVGP